MSHQEQETQRINREARQARIAEQNAERERLLQQRIAAQRQQQS